MSWAMFEGTGICWLREDDEFAGSEGSLVLDGVVVVEDWMMSDSIESEISERVRRGSEASETVLVIVRKRSDVDEGRGVGDGWWFEETAIGEARARAGGKSDNSSL